MSQPTGIKPYIIRTLRDISIAAGQRVPRPAYTFMKLVTENMELGRWMRKHQCPVPLEADKREEVWEAVCKQVKNKKVLYLEFGVWQGASIRFWAERLTHPASNLHGFDSFEGLPDTEGVWKKGQFNVEGRMPSIPDPRVKFFKGWFNETLPQYTPPEHDVLVINIDADLYSSTIYVLRQLRPYIRPGTFIYFDEFHLPEHELRAMDEFMDETGLKFRGVSGTRNFTHVFIECVS